MTFEIKIAMTFLILAVLVLVTILGIWGDIEGIKQRIDGLEEENDALKQRIDTLEHPAKFGHRSPPLPLERENQP